MTDMSSRVRVSALTGPRGNTASRRCLAKTAAVDSPMEPAYVNLAGRDWLVTTEIVSMAMT